MTAKYNFPAQEKAIFVAMEQEQSRNGWRTSLIGER
jgi:hypothetical protein